MSSDNPYQPPNQESTKLHRQERLAEFKFGWKGNLVLGIVSGVLVGLLIKYSFDDDHPFFLFGYPLVGWFITLIVMLSTLRSIEISAMAKGFLAAGLTIPAYVLYIPICSMAGMFSTPIFGSDGYGPTEAGAIFASVLSFVLILFAVASYVRRKVRVSDPESNSEPLEREA